MAKNELLFIGGGLLLAYLLSSKRTDGNGVKTATPPQTLQDVPAKEIIKPMEINTLANVQAEMQRKLQSVRTSGKSARFISGEVTRITTAMRKAGIDPRAGIGKLDYSNATISHQANITQARMERARTTDPVRYPISARYG